MRVMTFNIWNYEGHWEKRSRQITDLIRQHRPDAVALQETRHDFRFARGMGQGDQLAHLTGYIATWALAQVYIPILRVDEGLTILTREPPIQTMLARLTLDPHHRADENHRICLGVTISVDGGEVCIFNTHYSLSAAARETNAVETSRFVREWSNGRVALLMGDLNAEPTERSMKFLRGAVDIMGETSDFVDCWTMARPSEPGFTYASWEPVRRIDYILARNMTPGTVRVEIVGGENRQGIYPSDHLGLVADLHAL